MNQEDNTTLKTTMTSKTTTEEEKEEEGTMFHVALPWSKRHKALLMKKSGGVVSGERRLLKYSSFSNSFAEPLSCQELIDWAVARGNTGLVNDYYYHSLKYTPNGGSYDLRQAISELYGPKIKADNILVFPGAQVALQTAAQVIVGGSGSGEGGYHSITFTPGYQSVQEGPLLVGGTVTKIQLVPENGWQIDVDQVEAAIQSNTRYMVINEPYNPAGTLMKRSVQTALVNLAKRHGIYIMCDEVYRLLEHKEEDRLPAMADCYEEKGLSCVTLSKPFGACGVTIGWIACQDVTLMDKLSDQQYFGTACPSRASELQAIMTLEARDVILARNMKIIRSNKILLEEFMEEYQKWFTWVPPTAGAIAAIRFKGPLSSAELGEMLAEEAGIGIKPQYCFTSEEDERGISKDHDYFRIGFGESVMPEALRALRTFVEQHQNEWEAATTTSTSGVGEEEDYR